MCVRYAKMEIETSDLKAAYGSAQLAKMPPENTAELKRGRKNKSRKSTTDVGDLISSPNDRSKLEMSLGQVLQSTRDAVQQGAAYMASPEFQRMFAASSRGMGRGGIGGTGVIP